MGTSAASSPVSGNPPLIPSWVAGDYPVELQGDEPSETPAESEPSTRPDPAARRFSSARSHIGSAIRLTSTGGGSGGGATAARRSAQTPRGHVRKAVQSYVSALGGSRGVATRLGVAVDVGARLFQVLDRVAREGLEAALHAFGRSLNETSAGAVADALMTLVCEDAALGLEGILDESMARAACDETFISLYEQGILLSELRPEQVPDVIRSFAINAACLMITRDIATSLIDRPRTEQEVGSLQNTLQSVIASSMLLELPSSAVSETTIGELRRSIASAYDNAFRILGAGRES